MSNISGANPPASNTDYSALIAAAIAAGGGAASAYGQNKAAQAMADANRAMTAEQFAATMAQRKEENDRQNAVQGNNAAPLGQNRDFAAHSALMNAIMGGAQNVHSTPGDAGVAAAMGSHTGGLRLPEGGIKDLIESLYGQKATLASLAQHDKQVAGINPMAPQINYGDLGMGGPQADEFMKQRDNYQLDQVNRQTGNNDQVQRSVNLALENSLADRNQSNEQGFWGKTGDLMKKSLMPWNPFKKKDEAPKPGAGGGGQLAPGQNQPGPVAPPDLPSDGPGSQYCRDNPNSPGCQPGGGR